MVKKLIPKKLYEQIIENSIISAVDAIIVYNKKVLVGKRTQEPAKGKWWIPGGRQKKGELPEEAVKRLIKKEIGLDVNISKLVGVYDPIFKKTAFPNIKTGVHYVSRVYLVHPINKDFKVNLDKTQKEYKWIENIGEDLEDYVKTALKESKVFKK
ncbi:MAG: NUDIX domain-containing protein [archaeon]|nr:NUDIX domain-containing protein [archaeon]MCR4323839.1 NUDIX domain-containing protein [Nanoarchaeota archaeon]